MSTVAFAVAACGALIGIDDRGLDPGEDSGGTTPESGPKFDSGSASDAPSIDAAIDTGPVIADFPCGQTANCRTPMVCCVKADFNGTTSGGVSISIKDRSCVTTCQPGGSSYTATLHCAKSADCAKGQVCCFRPTTQSTGSATCSSSCNGGGGTFQLCESPADCDSASARCETAFIPPYKSCR